MASPQLGGLVEIGGERDAMENAAHETLQIVAFAADTIGGPAEGAFGRRTGRGEMVAVGCDHAGAAQFVFVKRFENFAGRGLVRDNNGVTAGTESRFDGREKS